MNLPRQFEEYVKQGTINKCSVNKPRAEFLVSETEKTFRGLNKRLEIIGIDEDNANSIIKDCYDIMHEKRKPLTLVRG